MRDKKQCNDEVYKKVIRTVSGSFKRDGTIPRCPECKSTNVKEGDGMFEFTEMICNNCGNKEFLDFYQLEDWYPR